MVLFFIRQFNDIDHMTPIIWKMHRDGYPVAVYCLEPAYDIDTDYRLAFLKRLGIGVTHLYDEPSRELDWRHRVLRRISAMCFRISNRLKRVAPSLGSPVVEWVRNRALKYGKKGFNRSRKNGYHSSWAESILVNTSARALCFDHINPGRYVVQPIVDAARALSIPTFALPHGVFIYTNRHVRIGTTEESRLDKFNCFDFIVTQNRLRKDVLVRAGVEEMKIHVLGSARYSDEWMEQNRKILPRTGKLNGADSSTLKAVFMTTRFAYRVDVDRMLATFDRLSSVPGLHLVVKPHTRSGVEAEAYDGLPVGSVSDISSVELCEWADIVLVIGSSILIEPLKMNKPVLYLKYLHENTTQYEEMGACWTISDEEALMDAIRSLADKSGDVPYKRDHVDAFLSEIVFGGGRKKNVLDVYEQFIVSGGMTSSPHPCDPQQGSLKDK